MDQAIAGLKFRKKKRNAALKKRTALAQRRPRTLQRCKTRHSMASCLATWAGATQADKLIFTSCDNLWRSFLTVSTMELSLFSLSGRAKGRLATGSSHAKHGAESGLAFRHREVLDEKGQSPDNQADKVTVQPVQAIGAVIPDVFCAALQMRNVVPQAGADFSSCIGDGAQGTRN